MSNDNEMFWDVLCFYTLIFERLELEQVCPLPSILGRCKSCDALPVLSPQYIKVLDFRQSYSGHEFLVSFLFSLSNQSCFGMLEVRNKFPATFDLSHSMVIRTRICPCYTGSLCFFRCWIEAIALAWVVSLTFRSRSTGLRFLASLVTMVLARRNLARHCTLGMQSCTEKPRANINGTLACL